MRAPYSLGPKLPITLSAFVSIFAKTRLACSAAIVPTANNRKAVSTFDTAIVPTANNRKAVSTSSGYVLHATYSSMASRPSKLQSPERKQHHWGHRRDTVLQVPRHSPTHPSKSARHTRSFCLRSFTGRAHNSKTTI
jgi:hypothetical protein